MDLGTKVTTRSTSWKRARYLGSIILLFIGLGALLGQLHQSPQRAEPYEREVTALSLFHHDIKSTENVAHGHDQDIYRDFIFRQWESFKNPVAKAGKSEVDWEIPQSFGLCRDCKGAEKNWQRFAAIAALCLDYNRDVREAHKGWDKHRTNWTSQQFFDDVRARWMKDKMESYLHDLHYVRELRRYVGTKSEENAGFVAYHHGMDRQELLVVVQGSMEGHDGLMNFRVLSTVFDTGVLMPLNVTPCANSKGLREHTGYSKVVVEVYPQIQQAIVDVESRYGKLKKIVVSGHSLGSAVGAGLLKVIEAANEYEGRGMLYAQPNSFKVGFWNFLWNQHLTDDQQMVQSIVNVHNIEDPVVVASETGGLYDALGTELSFGGGKFDNPLR